MSLTRRVEKAMKDRVYLEIECTVTETSETVVTVVDDIFITVEGPDGDNIPHFHVCKGHGSNVITAIRFKENAYFIDDNHSAELQKKGLKAIHNIMKSPWQDRDTKEYSGETVYEHLANKWNDYLMNVDKRSNNPELKVDPHGPIPDYSNTYITTSKDEKKVNKFRRKNLRDYGRAIVKAD